MKAIQYIANDEYQGEANACNKILYVTYTTNSVKSYTKPPNTYYGDVKVFYPDWWAPNSNVTYIDAKDAQHSIVAHLVDYLFRMDPIDLHVVSARVQQYIEDKYPNTVFEIWRHSVHEYTADGKTCLKLLIETIDTTIPFSTLVAIEAYVESEIWRHRNS